MTLDDTPIPPFYTRAARRVGATTRRARHPSSPLPPFWTLLLNVLALSGFEGLGERGSSREEELQRAPDGRSSQRVEVPAVGWGTTGDACCADFYEPNIFMNPPSTVSPTTFQPRQGAHSNIVRAADPPPTSYTTPHSGATMSAQRRDARGALRPAADHADCAEFLQGVMTTAQFEQVRPGAGGVRARGAPVEVARPGPDIERPNRPRRSSPTR